MGIDGNMYMIDQHLDSLDAQAEADELALKEFFGFDYELFLKTENEKYVNNSNS